MFYYINNFIFFSIFGFFFETLIFSILGMHNQSGFMYLWWTPFYGTGVIISIITYNYLKNIIKNKITLYILLFISLFFMLSLLELIGGHLLYYLHGYSLWNYQKIPLHIGKYISFPTSLAWSSFSTLYLRYIKKYTDTLEKHIPKFITIILSFIFIIDFILTIINLLLIKFA